MHQWSIAIVSMVQTISELFLSLSAIVHLSSRKKDKGRIKGTHRNKRREESLEAHWGVEKEHCVLLNILEHEGVGYIVAQEAVMNLLAVLAFRQLTTIMEDLQRWYDYWVAAPVFALFPQFCQYRMQCWAHYKHYSIGTAGTNGYLWES